ncbi:MAG: AmmeMemoRadiSam system protein B, partial [Gammaproteobacteria bacterium]
DADELDRLLHRYLDAVDEEGDEEIDAGDIRGLISPHIDYVRGGPVYAHIWKRAEKAIKAADLVVLLGTDHLGGDSSLTLTRQHYATPFGILPTARDVVDELADALGHQAAFAGELYHRSEHSIDLAAVWLHFMRGKLECEIVPILCGSFAHFIGGDEKPASDPTLNSVIGVLRQAIDGRQALVVAAADLAHVGSAFGGRPLDLTSRAQMQAADCRLMEQMCAGDAEGFFTAVNDDRDRYNVCGLSSIYLTMRALAPVRGEQVIYDRCPADQNDTSLVSICGILFA